LKSGSSRVSRVGWPTVDATRLGQGRSPAHPRPLSAKKTAARHAGLADELTHLLLSHARNGNVVAAIFLAKARCGWREGELPAGAADRVNVTINLPGALSEAEYRRMVDVTPAPKELPDGRVD